MKVTSTITSFPSTQQWTNRKLAILKCVILIMIKYKDTPEDKEPTSVENMLSSQVSTYPGKDAFFVVLQKDDPIRVTVTGVVVVCDLTPAPTPVLTPNPTFPPMLWPNMPPTSSTTTSLVKYPPTDAPTSKTTHTPTFSPTEKLTNPQDSSPQTNLHLILQRGFQQSLPQYLQLMHLFLDPSTSKSSCDWRLWEFPIASSLSWQNIQVISRGGHWHLFTDNIKCVLTRYEIRQVDDECSNKCNCVGIFFSDYHRKAYKYFKCDYNSSVYQKVFDTCINWSPFNYSANVFLVYHDPTNVQYSCTSFKTGNYKNSNGYDACKTFIQINHGCKPVFFKGKIPVTSPVHQRVSGRYFVYQILKDTGRLKRLGWWYIIYSSWFIL